MARMTADEMEELLINLTHDFEHLQSLVAFLCVEKLPGPAIDVLIEELDIPITEGATSTENAVANAAADRMARKLSNLRARLRVRGH